jgi:hypothetical protein
MNANEQSLAKFYAAFAVLDPAGMAPFYADNVQFDDEAFSLRGKQEVMGMWTMLCEATKAKGKDVWRLEYGGIQAGGNTGKAHWEAHYRFSATGRMVHNIIDGEFTFNARGLIEKHHDSFNFWRWSRQALGTPGLLLGWTPMLRNKVRANAAANLRKFMQSQNKG